MSYMVHWVWRMVHGCLSHVELAFLRKTTMERSKNIGTLWWWWFEIIMFTSRFSCISYRPAINEYVLRSIEHQEAKATAICICMKYTLTWHVATLTFKRSSSLIPSLHYTE